MKFYLLALILIIFTCSNTSRNFKFLNSKLIQQKNDTIQFIPKRNFNGKCNNDCVVFVANNESVKSVNGITNNAEYDYQLFIGCPTKYRLIKNREYTFIAQEYFTSKCAISTDSLINTKRYKLIKMIEK